MWSVGCLVRPLAMAKESNGRFEIGCIEGSAMHGDELNGVEVWCSSRVSC